MAYLIRQKKTKEENEDEAKGPVSVMMKHVGALGWTLNEQLVITRRHGTMMHLTKGEDQLSTRAAVDRCGAGYGAPPLVLPRWTPRTPPYGDRRLAPAPGWDLPSFFEHFSEDIRIGGMRPRFLLDPRPQEKLEQYGGIGYELVQALDAPVLQMVEEVDNLGFLHAPLALQQPMVSCLTHACPVQW